MADIEKPTHVDQIIAARTPALEPQDIVRIRQLRSEAMANPYLGPNYVNEMEHQIFGEGLTAQEGHVAKLGRDRLLSEIAGDESPVKSLRGDTGERSRG